MGTGKHASSNADATESWSDERYSLKVTQKPGFFCTIRLAAVLDLPPHEAFTLLARPDSHNVFRSITGNTYRKVLLWRERAPGREVLQVETEAKARWKLGVFKGSFDTRLIVDLDSPKRTIDFQLSRQGGMMKAFEGHWTVQPWEDSLDLDDIVRSAPTTQTLGATSVRAEANRHTPSPQHDLQSWLPWHGGGGRRQRRCLVTLEQSLMPSVVPPGPLGGLVKGISSAQVRAMLGDLRAEAARINAGSPTPSPNDVGLADEFGFEGGGGSSPAPGAAPPGGAAAAALSGLPRGGPDIGGGLASADRGCGG